MSTLNYELFFKQVPDKIKYLFNPSQSVWTLLNGGLKEFFNSQSDKNILLGKISPQAYLKGSKIYISKNARIEAGAFIKGPCYIDEGSQIRHGAYLRGNVFVSKNCVVGHCTEVKHSVFLDGAKAGHFNYIGDSILGNNINLGAGTKLANLKMTSGSIKVKTDSICIDTGLKKFGAILGDNTKTGCNSVLNPGSILAPKSFVFSNVSVYGVHLKRVKLKK